MQRLILLFGVGTLITACAHDHLAERNIANEPGELIVKIGSKEVKRLAIRSQPTKLNAITMIYREEAEPKNAGILK
jgi:hypothetical protein